MGWYLDSGGKKTGSKKMDIPIAELMVKWFCEGYAKQAAKEEEEKERRDENRRNV